MSVENMDRLARIARIRAESELRHYAAYRAQADAMQRQVDTVRGELSAAIAAPASDALDQWRIATALVGYRATQLHRTEEALARMKPGLETARAAALRAFGRAEALLQLQRLTAARENRERERRRP